ncbi:MAG: 4Fe-4S dicluster domain-containing protein [Nitrososphaerota archaeon]|nr:4Fe-4S dicluster domain-containing protein [Aigarchaeota archaeon]MDW8076728.1 4Fe-4S dicluster domain-containing protein [Nitrososphaerota archaeon]
MSLQRKPYFALDAEMLGNLVTILKDFGYIIYGPVERDGAIVYDIIESAEQIPRGLFDEQSPGRYRLIKKDERRYFGYVVGPQSPKYVLYPPQHLLFKVRKDGRTFIPRPDGKKVAIFGLRPCDLKAVDILDDVLLKGPYKNNTYWTLRKDALFIAVNCIEPDNNCFCTSMNTGPFAKSGCDICITELLMDGKHVFILETMTDKGAEIVNRLGCRSATEEELDAVSRLMEEARNKIRKKLNVENLKEDLYKNLEHPRWNDVGNRCLTCGNCTLVCPTCFCSSVFDRSSLSMDVAERWALWDSCFSIDYSYIHGGAIRQSIMSRYRNWLMHKLATWVDQFGTFGCVGCGRCITWCPVGIDIVEEANRVRS